MTNIWTKLGGRKLIAYVLGLTTVVSLSCVDKLSDITLWGILALTAVFTGGNVGEHLSALVKSRSAPSAQKEESHES